MQAAFEEQSWPPGGGGMGARVRAKDWSATPLGPAENWPQSLRIITSNVLDARFPSILLWGPDLIQIYNDSYQPILGARHPRALGQATAECWPEVWHFNAPIYERVLTRGETVFLEDQEYVLAPNGHEQRYYLTISYSPIRDDRGDTRGVLVTLVDTTRRVEAELAGKRLLEESRTSALTLQQWFDQAPGFIALLRGPAHIVDRVNPAYYALIGQRDVIGRPVFEALPEVRHQGYEEIMDAVYRTGRPYAARNCRVLLQRAPDSPLTEAFVDLTYQPLFDAQGEVTGIFTQGYDVTDQARATQALRDSEERFRLAAESSSLGTFDWDLVASTLRFSPEACQIFDIDDGVIHVEDAIARIHPDDVDAVRHEIERALDAAGDGKYEVRHRTLHRNGRVCWAHVLGRVKFDYDAMGIRYGVRFAGVVWDITEQHKLVEALREADRRKDEFLATLAHELRNPLAPIRQATHISRSPKISESELRWSQSIIERQVQHMALLLDDLLDVSRISLGRLALRKEEVDLGQVIEAALETARPLIEAKHHTLSVDLPEHPITVYADPLRLAQILSNLLTNAAKYTDAHGGIWLSAGTHGEQILISVLDNGIGLSSEAQPRIFEMFSQVSSIMDRSEGGLGIGLALTRGLAELHGGGVDVISAGIGKGAEFIVRLPWQNRTATPTTTPAPQVPATRRPCTVLVADDNIDALDSLALLLSLDGHEVLCARDGEEALMMAARARPDVAIFDIGMPRLNGYDVARRIRGEPWGRDMMLIALTGWGSAEDQRRALDAGFDHHCTKPIDPARLEPWLSEAAARA
ncbi:MAG: ATP-binding protein [Rhodocyclaceae bacterium]